MIPRHIPVEAPIGKWDRRAISVAQAVAGWSSCTRAKVGAVVMSREHDVISTGFNDTPAGWPNCGDGGCPRVRSWAPSGSPQQDKDMCLHAEANALQRAGLAARGSTLITTRTPCQPCYRAALTAGIERIVVAP